MEANQNPHFYSANPSGLHYYCRLVDPWNACNCLLRSALVIILPHFYRAPLLPKTTGTVLAKISISNHNDHRAISSASISIHSSKSTSLRPLICHIHVIPGLTANLFRCFESYKLTSFINGGLGPTKLISPLKTLNNWGSSSILVLRINLPSAVTLGSLVILKTGPLISFK